jgi:hypothetical protein
MTDMVAFLMKDIGLLVMSVYLLRQDLIRALRYMPTSAPLPEARVQQTQSVLLHNY